MGGECNHQLDEQDYNSNSDWVPLQRVPPLTQEIPLPGGSPTRIRLDIMDLIEVGLQPLVSELIQQGMSKELDTKKKETSKVVSLQGSLTRQQ